MSFGQLSMRSTTGGPPAAAEKTAFAIFPATICAPATAPAAMMTPAAVVLGQEQPLDVNGGVPPDDARAGRG